MGFNNDGVQVVADRLKAWRESSDSKGNFLIGGNIGKNKITPNEDAWKDYEICFRALCNWVDYFVVNVSSPNTPGLRELQEKDSLQKILSHLQTINSLQKIPRPILLKIAPDLTAEQLNDVAEIANGLHLDGLVVANTTISREKLQTPLTEVSSIGAGGLSGLPVRDRATEVLQYLHQRLHRTIPIIASGGIFTAADAKAKLDAGASMVQVWTGFIYEGPEIVKKIVNGLGKVRG
jgi:dihydroorotate dehydrogenase